MNTNSPFLHSAHRDVLECPIPDDEGSKKSLFLEIKNRGRSAVMGQVWMDAKYLYTKALELLDEENDKDKKELSIVSSNLSLVYSKMGHYEDAEAFAVDATKHNPAYLKGWWRLGQAQVFQQDYQTALASMDKAQAIEPTNKALNKEIQKIQKLLEEKPEADKAAAAAKKASSSSTTSSSSRARTTTTTAKSSQAGKDDDEEMDEGKTFTKSDHVKGYQVVNGKKTTFFHNELSEEAKALIGDIAPQKLAAASNTPTPIDKSMVMDTTSAWNKAGTWEEKDVTKWATESLTKMLVEETTYDIPLEGNWKKCAKFEGDLAASIDKIKVLDGHASYVSVRGKKRYIFEFRIELVWRIDKNTNTKELLTHGELTFPDIDGSNTNEEFDIENYKIKKNFEEEKITDQMTKEVILGKVGLRCEFQKTIKKWVKLFHKTY